MRGWQKAQLTDELEIMDEMIENPDNEDEMLLQDAMRELLLEGDEQNDDDDEIELVVVVVVEDFIGAICSVYLPFSLRYDPGV